MQPGPRSLRKLSVEQRRGKQLRREQRCIERKRFYEREHLGEQLCGKLERRIVELCGCAW